MASTWCQAHSATGTRQTAGSRTGRWDACGQHARRFGRVGHGLPVFGETPAPISQPSRFHRELSACTRPMSWAELVGERNVSEYALRGRNWRQTSRGHYVPADVDRDAVPAQRIVEAVPLIPPEGALTGWASAYVHGVYTLDGYDRRTMRPLRVEIIRGADRGHIPREWVASCRDRLPPDEVVTAHGIRVTTPIRTAFDGMRKASSLGESVAFADAMIAARLVSQRTLTAYVDSRPGWRGSPVPVGPRRLRTDVPPARGSRFCAPSMPTPAAFRSRL
jgi:hypothetical protein